jgi:hypothetical protein
MRSFQWWVGDGLSVIEEARSLTMTSQVTIYGWNIRYDVRLAAIAMRDPIGRFSK